MTCLFLLLLAFPAAAQSPRRSAIDTSRLVDLSYPFDETTLYWPTAAPFEWRKDAWGQSEGGYWYASATFTTSEHGGTHLDSPVHFSEDGMATHEIPLDRLIGPAAVIDVSAKCARDRDYRLTAGDIQAWESRHGALRQGDIVLVRTGWGQHWPDARLYLGSDKRGDASGLHFPGLSRHAAELFVRRKVSGVGIDTASLDHGPSKDFIVHRVLNGANIYGLENVANLHRLPESGATVIALPAKVRNGTGGPARVVGILP